MSSYPGAFHDGRSAVRREVRIRLVQDSVEVTDARGRPLAAWPLAGLRLLPDPSRDRSVRLTVRGDEAARLTVGDPRFRQELLAAAPHLMPRRRWWRALGWGGAIGAGLAAAAVLLVELAPQAAVLVPPPWERELGVRLHARVVDYLADSKGEGQGVCASADGRAALQRLTGRLAAPLETPYGFRVTVLDIAAANAVALPGGYIIVFRGMLELAESPDELAGVLAHEMAHVVARHPLRNLIRTSGLRLLASAMFGSSLGEGLLASASAAAVQGAYGRAAEAEADRRAVALLRRAGLRTTGLADLFERLAEARPEVPEALAWLATHPSSAERAERARAAASEGAPALSDAGWRSLEAICGGRD